MQPSSDLSFGPRAYAQRLGIVAVMAMALCACSKGSVSNGALASAPTVDSLPQETAQAQLSVAGDRPPNTLISAKFADGAVQILAIAGDTAAVRWSGTMHLAEGINAFVLIAQDTAGNQYTSAPYTIVLNPAPPSVPAIDGAYDGAAFIYTAQGAAPVLVGDKDPNTSILINGVVTTPLDAATRWQYALPPLDATTPLTLTVTATNKAGLVSPAVQVALVSTTTPPVTVDAVVSPTAQPVMTLSGSHTAGAAMHAIWQGQKVDTSIAAADATHFAFTADLAKTGVTDGVLWAIFSQSIGGVQGPYTCVPIAYDTVPPLAPLIAVPLQFGAAAPIIVAGQSTPASLELSGALPELGSTLCIGLGAALPCQIAQGPADTFSVFVPLQQGANQVVVTALDATGNASQALEATVYVTTPPALVIDSPYATDLLSGDSATVTGHVYLAPADAALTQAALAMAIDDVAVCIDNSNCQTAAVHDGAFSVLLPLTNVTSGSHTLSVRGTTQSGARYISDANSAGSVAVTYFSATPNWLNGNQTTPVGARAPQLALDAAGTAHIVWEDFCPNLGSDCPVPNTGAVGPDIFYTTRSNTGVWARTVRSLSAPGLIDGQSRTPTITVDAANLVHVAWSDNGSIVGSPNSNYGILHRTIDPTSGAWSNIDVVAGQDGVHAKQPQLAANTYGAGAQVHLTWQRDSGPQQTPPVRDIYYAKQQAALPLNANTQFGAWSAPLKVTADPNTGSAAFPDVAMGPDGHVSVVWQECRNSACAQSPSVHSVRLIDVIDPNTIDPLGSVVVNDSLTDFDGVQPAISATPDNSRHIIWQGLAETGGADPNTSAIFGRTFRGRAPDVRQPAALWLSSGTSTAARAPWVTGTADGRFAIAWSQTTTSSSRSSRIAIRLGTMTLGPGPKALLLPDTGSVALHPSIALDPILPQAAHVVWDNLLTLGTGVVTTTKQNGAFYAIAAAP